MIPVLDRKEKTPIFRQLYEFFKQAIMRGNLPHNEALPSIRQLAQQLAIGINTVIKAYEQLVAEGYLYNKPQQGYFVDRVAGWMRQPNGQTAEWRKPIVSPPGNPQLSPARFNVCPWSIDTARLRVGHILCAGFGNVAPIVLLFPGR